MEKIIIPRAYILIGVPAAGKSTWVTSQDWYKNCAWVSTDKHVEEYAKTSGKTYSEVFSDFMPHAISKMVSEVNAAKSHNIDIIWDQTSTTVASRRKKFKMLPEYYHIAVVFKTPVASELMKRLASRPGKVIPWNVVSGMIDSFEMPTEAEGFKEIWYV